MLIAMVVAVAALCAAMPARAEKATDPTPRPTHTSIARELVTNGWWGIQASYAVKWYDYHSGSGRLHHVNWFGEDGTMSGIRFGIGIHPSLSNDWGISTGAFLEIFSCVNRTQTKRIEDVQFYLPGHVLWQRRMSSWVRLHVETGPGFTWGFLQKIIDPKNSMHKGYHVPFDEGSPRGFNFWWDIGAGVDIKMFRVSVDFSLGLTPSMRYLSVMGLGTEFYRTVPRRLSFNFGIVF